MKKLFTLLLLASLLIPQSIYAFEFPQNNNKFGIHLAQPSDEDMKKAAELVNSNGGKWGYVTLVIEEHDRDKNKWNGVFEKLLELRLIPIIRIATKNQGGSWRRPEESEAEEWARFLNSLRWVTKNRYVILFNEPNHGNEWGGAVDAESFARVNRAFAQKLKIANSDFFVMMGGLDGAAPSARPAHEDSGIFLQKVIETIGADEFNRLFDGLCSHSYPNPGFVGSPNGSGKQSVRGYQWELSLLKDFGVKDLPVFITETGWNASAIGRDQSAQNIRAAYEQIWLQDDRVIAVTPFILNYQGEPFLQFSWLTLGDTKPQAEFTMVQGMSKQAGRPQFHQSGEFVFKFPKEIVAESTYHFRFKLKNTGQGIWAKEDGYRVEVTGIDSTSYIIDDVRAVKPTDERSIDVFFKTSSELGKREARLTLYEYDKKILESAPWSFEIVPLPALDFETSLFPKFVSKGEKFEMQVFDVNEEVIYKQTDITVDNGKGHLEKVENIALGEKYRVVLLKQNYLPVQTYVTFQKGTNNIEFPKMYPLDFNGDGAGTWKDVGGMFTNAGVFGLWWPGN